jgi:integrase
MPRQEQGIEWYLTPSGQKRYKVRWRENGTHAGKSFRRLTGPDGARAHYQKVRQAQEAGKRVTAAGSASLTLAQFMDEVWAEKREEEVVPGTWEADFARFDNYIREQLGGRPIAQIDAEDLVEWQDGLRKAGAGAPSQLKAITLLIQIFKEAGRRPRTTGVTLNPVLMLEKPEARRRQDPSVWGPVVVERVRWRLVERSMRRGKSQRVKRMKIQDAALVSIGYMAGLRPGEALALRWRDIEDGRLWIRNALSEDEIVSYTKTKRSRRVPIIGPLDEDLKALRRLSDDEADDFIFRKPSGAHFTGDYWKKWHRRHLANALEGVETEWQDWRDGHPKSKRKEIRPETAAGLAGTRPYDLGRHTHSSLNLASGMRIEKLARIQGHSIRVLSETYSQILDVYEDEENIDIVSEIRKARKLACGGAGTGSET